MILLLLLVVVYTLTRCNNEDKGDADPEEGRNLGVSASMAAPAEFEMVAHSVANPAFANMSVLGERCVEQRSRASFFVSLGCYLLHVTVGSRKPPNGLWRTPVHNHKPRRRPGCRVVGSLVEARAAGVGVC